jgi:hypothetical protein
MAKADIGDHRGHGLRCGLGFVQSDHSAREKSAEPTSQFPASVRTIRNQKDCAVAGHRCCTGFTDGFQVENGTNSILGGNLPIFGKTLIVAASGLAPAAHDLHGVETVTAMTAAAQTHAMQ